MEINKLFRENIKRLRLKNGLTQESVAKAAGLTVAAFREYEAGRRSPDMEKMGNIALALGVNVSDLFADSPIKEVVQPTLRVLPSRLMQKLAIIPDDVYEAIFEAGELDEDEWGIIKDMAKNASERNKARKKSK